MIGRRPEGVQAANSMKLLCFWRFTIILSLAFAFHPAFAQDKKEKAADTPKAAEGQKGEKPTPKDLPPAQEVINRFLKEMGGKDTYEKHKSQHAKGTVEMPGQQIKGSLELFAAQPNKMLVKIDLPGAGPVTTGYDGKVGFMVNPLIGPMLLEGKMLEQVASQADFDHILHPMEDYKSMETIDLVPFEGQECYKLKLVDKSGMETIEYFSKKTGLQAGLSMRQESPLGAMNVTTAVSDYKKFGDITMPARISQKIAGMEQVMTFDTVEWDTVQDDVFELPKEVKALLEKQDDSKKEDSKQDDLKKGDSKKSNLKQTDAKK
jgi:hypothetical protein